MNRIGKYLTPLVAVAFAVAGCHSNQNQNQNASQTQPAASNGDPADANVVPASYTTDQTNGQNPPGPPADQSAAPSDETDNYQEGPPPTDYDSDETDEDVAPQPPPALPDYDQPPCPGPDYEWTPGYWAYAPQGYYWVPGAWVMAPWQGALWTPGYWGYYGGRYSWYPGYWGLYIGFYGGVNYGFGYSGNGYEGGYWRDNHFYYNTAVTHVNETVIHNVYNYRVVNQYNTSRVAYNGGRGGLNYRPTPQQMVARNQQHTAPLPAQRDLMRSSMQNHAQFASANHGRPQQVADNRPMNDGRSAPAARPADIHPVAVARPEERPAANRPEAGAAPAARPEARPAPAARPEERPAPAARPEARSAPAARPEARPEAKPAPKPQARPAPKPGQKPQPRPEDNHPHR